MALNTGKHQFEVRELDKQKPKAADIIAASKKAGFVVEPPKNN